MSEKKDMGEKLEPVSEAVARAAAAVSETAKDAAKKAEPTVKAARKRIKTAAKKAEPAVKAAQEKLQDAAKKAEPAVKAAEKSIRATGKKVAAVLVPEMYVEWDGRQVSCADVLERAKQDFKAANKGAVRSCRIYIKPEDGKAYYVINDQVGKINL